MIDDHKEIRRLIHMAHISDFMYEFNMMIFVLKSFFDGFYLYLLWI